jgi:ABC-type transport system substrate-binding protein
MQMGKKLAAVVVAAALALSGCSSSGESSGTGTGAQIKTLRLPTSAAPTSFTIGQWGGGDATLLRSVYDTILSQDLDGKIVGSIAESWKYSDDRKTLTLTIRSGMKFTDGEPVDAAAVVASLEALRKGASTSAWLSAISEVKASDSSTVVVTLSEPNAALLAALAGVAGVVGSPKSLTTESSKLEPVGSGAYTIDKSATTVGALYTLKKNSDNWNAKAYPFETVTLRVMQDPTAVQNAVLAGQLDHAGITPEQATLYDTSKFTTGQSKPQAVGALWFVDRAGKLVPALADVRVRRAINLAFDRSLIESSLNKGTSHATNQVFSPTGQAYSADLLTAKSFDVDSAKKLMADAGYANGFTVTMPSVAGVTTNFESTITQLLGDIGVKVTWESVPFQDFFKKVFTGTYGMFFFFNGFTGSDALDAQASLSGLFNPTGFITPELQALVDAANAAPEDKQAAAYQAINKHLVDEAWAAPIIYATGIYVASKNITFTPPVIGSQNLLPFRPAGS